MRIDRGGFTNLNRKKGPAEDCPSDRGLISEQFQRNPIAMSEERQLKFLRLLKNNPEITQRALAEALDVSLGAGNFCLKVLANKGWIKIANFRKNSNKRRYLYFLTPLGIRAKQN